MAGIGQGIKTGKIVMCENCGKEIYKAPFELVQKHHYCSKKCFLLHYRKGQFATCVICEKQFWMQNWQLRRSEKYYCSRECWRKRDVLEISKKISNTLLGKYTGENHSQWRGGISFEPYPITFNNQLKDKIRVRDKFICQKCGVPELECDRRLATHHIDYNKKNCKESNLISLCNSCHTKTNTNRKYWTNYFKETLIQIKTKGGE